MTEEFKPRNKEFFECDCYGKDHLIRAEYSKWVMEFPKGNESYERDLNICFETKLADYNTIYLKDNKFIQFKDRWIWRIKNAFKILVTGEITTEGYFSPCRSLVETKSASVENLFGYETTKNLAKWLDVKADELKNDYDKDVEKYKQDNLHNPQL